jgi:CRISPR/Cas system-associated protein Cas10 (large subunit of type III CRISPR-Cas system)
MEDIIRCQSCGMPLADGFFGTEKDQVENQEFCKFCYQDGSYLQPEISMQEMIDMSVNNMMSEQGYDESYSRELANQFIPTLKRWRISS